MGTRSTPSRISTPASFRCAAREGANGAPLQVSVDFTDRQVHAAVWVAQVGRVPLLLLDTDLAANEPADRPITHILYVRGREMRLCQELVLGVGGVRALRALGVEPAVWHLNEGHSAFLLLERARELMVDEAGLDASEALRRVGRSSVFTIHTPVAAGNEVFDRELVTRSLAPWFAATGADPDALLELGRGRTDEPNAPFDMTAFVLRHAADANAVSQLHAETATESWEPLAGRRDRGHHQRGPRADMAGQANAGGLRARDRRVTWDRPARPAAVRAAGARERRGAVGRPRAAEAGARLLHAGSAGPPVRPAWGVTRRAPRARRQLQP